MNEPKAPLTLFLIWDANFEEGHYYAKLFYQNFTRNYKDPFARDVGIPIRIGLIAGDKIIGIDGKKEPLTYTTKNKNGDDERSFHHARYERTATIILLESNFVLNESYKTIEHLIEEFKQDKNHLLIPVALDFSEIGASSLSGLQYLRLFEREKSRKDQFLLINVAHELLKLLNNHICFNENQKPRSQIRQPVKFFLSHAKIDGLDITQRLREHIHKDFPIYSFFDANNLPLGERFEESLEDEIKQSILIAIQTDNYSSRTWCTQEVEWAKKHRRPIIVLDMLKQGESKSYPYLGNVLVLRSDTDNLAGQLNNYDKEVSLSTLLMDDIILSALKESLRLRFHEELLSNLSAHPDYDFPNKIILSPHPPELLTIAHLIEEQELVEKDKNDKSFPYLEGLFVYPNPPINYREEKLLKLCKFTKLIQFITPTFLPLIWSNNVKGLKVNISISNPSKNELSNLFVRDMLIELAKQLLSLKVALVYGGALNFEPKNGFNFTETLIEIARTYLNEYGKNQVKKIINYTTFPFSTKIDLQKQAKFHHLIEFINIEPDKFLNLKKEYADEILNNNNEHTFFAKAHCLTKMRKIMTESIDARIVMGGKVDNFFGRYPGVVEETYLAMKMNKPVFLIGAFGGGATVIRDIFEEKKTIELTYKYQTKNKEIKKHLHFFNENSLTSEELKINYGQLYEFFKKQQYGKSYGKEQQVSKEDYGLNNHLSREENKRLFYSTDIHEIIRLIIKGLNEIASNKK